MADLGHGLEGYFPGIFELEFINPLKAITFLAIRTTLNTKPNPAPCVFEYLDSLWIAPGP